MEPVPLDEYELIQTPRLLLRIPLAADAPAIAAAVQASLKDLQPWLPWATDSYDRRDGELWARRTRSRFILNEQLGYLLFDRDTKALLGAVGPDSIDWKNRKCEIGYWLRSDRAGRGLMTEALTAVVELLGAVGLRRIEVRCDRRNVASAAVARRCGFELDGILRADGVDRHGRATSTIVFSRLMGDVTDAAPVAEPLQSAP